MSVERVLDVLHNLEFANAYVSTTEGRSDMECIMSFHW
jgi:hypothetical protein